MKPETKTWEGTTRIYRFTHSSPSTMEGIDKANNRRVMITVRLPETNQWSWDEWVSLFRFLRDQMDNELEVKQ